MGTFAIIGIVSVQTYSLQKAWNIKEKQFNQTIFIGLNNVAEKMSTYNQTVLPNENPVNQLSSNYFVVNVNSVIDANILDYYLRTEFDMLNIKTDYEYAIYDCHNDKMVYGNYIQFKNTGKSINLAKNLPKYDEYLYYFGINFPSKKNYLSSDMGIWIIFSIILLISVIFFGYALFIILKQKHLSELQKDFINNMTHEFKTPLSSISISADVLGTADIINDPERLKNYSAIIKQESIRLNKQVEKVLQIARIEKSVVDLNIEEINIHEVIQSVITNSTANNNHKDVVITTEFAKGELLILADRLHITNILHNLLDNAIKYADKQPRIIVSTKTTPDKISIGIKDNGPGISREYQKKVFQKFFRIPTGNLHNVKGFGLGLYYVRNICRAHNWKIKLESETGEGATFYIKIPPQ